MDGRTPGTRTHRRPVPARNECAAASPEGGGGEHRQNPPRTSLEPRRTPSKHQNHCEIPTEPLMFPTEHDLEPLMIFPTEPHLEPRNSPRKNP